MKKMIAAGIAALMISGLILTTPVFASQSSDALSGISEGIQQDNNDENNGSAKIQGQGLDQLAGSGQPAPGSPKPSPPGSPPM